jgi:DNA-binding FadR family transcriptional regulator
MKATDAADAFLRSCVAEATKQGIYRLPPASRLARMARVSPVILLRALQRLKADGVVISRPGAGITIVAPLEPDLAVESTPRHFSWQAVMQRLRFDILNGKYGPQDELPQGKELCRAYGASPKTMRRALSRLVGARFLEPHRRGYRVHAAKRRAASRTVVLFAGTNTKGEFVPFQGRTRELFRDVERTLSYVNTAVSVFAYRPEVDRFVSPTADAHLLQSPGFLDSVCGFIMFPFGGQPHLTQRILLDRFGPQAMPVAIYDESGESPLPDISPFRVRRFCSAFSGMGSADIARHLLSLGHRSVAFISTVHQARYSRNRLAWLTQAFAQSGLTSAVAPVTASYSEGMTAEQDRRVRIGKIIDRLLTQKSADADEMTKRVGEVLSEFASEAKDRILANAADAQLEPLFNAALTNKNVSAWVCVSDNVALKAIRFLTKAGRRVPRDLSVCGYDDSLAASIGGLTSYNFNTGGTARAMANYLLDAGGVSGCGRPACDVEVEGSLVVRGSTAKAP